MAGPLEGIRVVDITKTIAGPYSASLLGDMGADVTKVEPPGTGEKWFLVGAALTAVLASHVFESFGLRTTEVDDLGRKIGDPSLPIS